MSSDNKLPEPHKNNKDIKFNIQPSKVKPIEDNIHIMFKGIDVKTVIKNIKYLNCFLFLTFFIF